MPGDWVWVAKLPPCDLHPDRKAEYDFRTTMGPWMNGCQDCFDAYGPGRLGTGYGQRLVLDQPKPTDPKS